MTPYLGVGLGYLNLALDNGQTEFSDGNFGAQAIIGLAFPLSPQWHAAIDYRLMGILYNIKSPNWINLNHTRVQTFNVRLDYVF